MAPSEKASSKDAAPAKPQPQAETPVQVKPDTPKEKPKAPSAPPSKPSPTEPQLPPKERERRVSISIFHFQL